LYNFSSLYVAYLFSLHSLFSRSLVSVSLVSVFSAIPRSVFISVQSYVFIINLILVFVSVSRFSPHFIYFTLSY
jgi:hypothetical protein